MNRNLQIYFTGDDPDDRIFAETIAGRTAEIGEPMLLDIDEMERMDARGERRPSGYQGTGLFVLSPYLLNNEDYRNKLHYVCPKKNLPGHTAFFICRGINPGDMMTQYPDLEELFLDIVIWEEERLDEMIVEMGDYIDHPERRLQPDISWLFKYLISRTVVSIGGLVNFFSLFGILILWGLFLLSKQTITQQGAFLLSLLSLYSAGWWLNKLPPLDFWPWLGRRWQFSEACQRPLKERMIDKNIMEDWNKGECIAPCLSQELHTTCLCNEFTYAEIWWLRKARIYHVFTLLFLFLHTYPLVILQKEFCCISVSRGILAFLTGFLFPVFFYWCSSWLRKIAYYNIGLKENEMNRTEKFFRPPSNRIKEICNHYFNLRTTPNISVNRAWFCPKDKIFISYSWTDPKDRETANTVFDLLNGMGKTVFLDKENIADFPSWRTKVSTHLLEATHIFVVLGPETLKGKICIREIKTSIQRWNTELFPSIICIIDPDVREKLIKDKETPTEVLYLLFGCPNITHKQSRNKELLDMLICQRRRQGLLKDWLSLLGQELSLNGKLKNLLKNSPIVPIDGNPSN